MRKPSFKTIQKLAIRSLAVAIFFSSIPAVSAVPFRNAFEQMDLINRETKELNLSMLARMQVIIDQYQMDLSKYIPYKSIPQYSQSQDVAHKVLRQTLKTWMSSDAATNSVLMQQASVLDNTLSTAAGTTAHKFNFRINALETQAEMIYKGVVEASVSYDLAGGDTQVQVSKQAGARTIAYTHLDNSDGQSDVIGVRWNF